jgi:acyl-CoA synthetase (AMP-forming)/AMP-acid ligase II
MPTATRSRPASRVRSARPARPDEVGSRLQEDWGVDPGEDTPTGYRLMLGYWNQSEASDAALAEGYLRTGDAGSISEARLPRRLRSDQPDAEPRGRQRLSGGDRACRDGDRGCRRVRVTEVGTPIVERLPRRTTA